MKKLLVLFSLLSIFVLTPSVLAQTNETELPEPGILPDSPVYFFKHFAEKVHGVFTFGEDSKALYALELADIRLSETKALSDKGKDKLAVDTALEAANENENAQEHLNKAESQGKDVTTIVAQLAANSARQQEVLAKVLENAPEQAKAAIQRAMEVSRRGLIKAQEMQTKEKGKPENLDKPAGTGPSSDNSTIGKPEGAGKSEGKGKPDGTGKPTDVPGKPK